MVIPRRVQSREAACQNDRSKSGHEEPLGVEITGRLFSLFRFNDLLQQQTGKQQPVTHLVRGSSDHQFD